jgi:phosphoribosylglycinamide formyltransferase 1
VLASGTGSNLQALLDACADEAPGPLALERAARAGVPTFVVSVGDFDDRAQWDAELAVQVSAHSPDLVVLAGFMKLVGPELMARFPNRIFNTHPALSPSFPGMHGPRDALAYGVKVTGCTLFVVDDGVDTGAIVAQACVPVLDDDDETTLHERIKTVERDLLVETIGRLAREGWTVSGRRVTIP